MSHEKAGNPLSKARPRQVLAVLEALLPFPRRRLDPHRKKRKRARRDLSEVRMRKKERAEWMELLTAERHERRQTTIEFMAQIKELADRIQHPEIRPVSTPEGYEPPEIPQAFAEMAQIGRDVSDIPDIGSTDRLLAEEKEIAKIGNVYEHQEQS